MILTNTNLVVQFRHIEFWLFPAEHVVFRLLYYRRDAIELSAVCVGVHNL